MNELELRLMEMKEKAIKNNDVIVYNSINAYQRHNSDPTVLINFIKQLYEENKELREKIYG